MFSRGVALSSLGLGAIVAVEPFPAARGWWRNAGMGRVPPPLDLSLLVGYLFVRSFFIYTRGLKTRLICTLSPSTRELAALPTHLHPPPPAANTVPLNDVTTARLDTARHETLYPLRPAHGLNEKKKRKINGRIRMNIINWIARRAPRFEATCTPFVNAGWDLLQSPF